MPNATKYLIRSCVIIQTSTYPFPAHIQLSDKILKTRRYINRIWWNTRLDTQAFLLYIFSSLHGSVFLQTHPLLKSLSSSFIITQNICYTINLQAIHFHLTFLLQIHILMPFLQSKTRPHFFEAPTHLRDLAHLQKRDCVLSQIIAL